MNFNQWNASCCCYSQRNGTLDGFAPVWLSMTILDSSIRKCENFFSFCVSTCEFFPPFLYPLCQQNVFEHFILLFFLGLPLFFSFLLEHDKMTFLWHGACQFASRCCGSLWLLQGFRICGSVLPLYAFVPTLNQLRFLVDCEYLLCRGGTLRREWLWVVRCC